MSINESVGNLRRFGRQPKGSFQPVKDESKRFHCYALSMNRVDLYRRMDQRVEEMVASGILDEVFVERAEAEYEFGVESDRVRASDRLFTEM